MKQTSRWWWSALWAVVSMLVVLSPQAAHSREVFGSTQNFSRTRADSSATSVAIRLNHVFIAWIDKETGHGDVYFRESSDRGLTYSAPRNLSDRNRAPASDVLVVRVEGNVYVLWEEDGIRLRVSHDFGVTFGPLQVLSDCGREPRLAAIDENVYVLWTRGSCRKGAGELLFRASHDFGDTFDAAIALDANARSRHPAIASEGPFVYVAWEEGAHVSFRRSADEGRSFEPARFLDEGRGASSLPQLATLGTNVYAVWQEGNGAHSEIAFRRSTTGGASFEPLLNLSQSRGASRRPLLDSFESSVYVVWEESLPGNSKIFFTRSLDEGETFDALWNVSRTWGSSSEPSLSSSGEVVRIAWREDLWGWSSDIFYRSSDDRGTSFGTVENLSQTPWCSARPLVLSSHLGVEVHVFWEEHLPGNTEILYRRGVPVP